MLSPDQDQIFLNVGSGTLVYHAHSKNIPHTKRPPNESSLTKRLLMKRRLMKRLLMKRPTHKMSLTPNVHPQPDPHKNKYFAHTYYSTLVTIQSTVLNEFFFRARKLFCLLNLYVFQTLCTYSYTNKTNIYICVGISEKIRKNACNV